MIAQLLWLLIAVDPLTLNITPVARYANEAECEIGRVQYEMQHVVFTECRRDG